MADVVEALRSSPPQPSAVKNAGAQRSPFAATSA
jgi:hypothetical protein